VVPNSGYQYKFQGQERQDELGLNWDSFKWRNYDYAIGRFMNIDPLTEKFPQWSPYVFSGNIVTMARELEGLEPSFLIENNKLSQGAITVMNAAFGYSVSSLKNTTWIPDTDPRTTILQDMIVDNRYVAMVDGNKVAYHSSISNRSDKYWFGLIGHEQQHRQDVDNYGYNLFYGSYALEAMRTFGDTDKMVHEKPGYRNEKYAKKLWDYNNGEVRNIFNTGNITENHRSQLLESVGSRFKRDVILQDQIDGSNNMISHVNGLIEGLGNSKEDQAIKSSLSRMVSGWQQKVKDAKKIQHEITKKYGQ
jgi:RHS repeat-associated protein